MKTNQALELIGDKKFIEKIFGYAYRRCYTSHEAEDLASDIILAVIGAIGRQKDIDNFYPFVWTVAHRVYADHCDKRNRTPITQSYENTDFSISSGDNEIDDFIEEEAAKELLSKTMREISFLAKIYRDVMVMFYLDELSVKQIAAKLGISENAVKQRLFSARNTVKKEVNNKMERNLSLKPVDLQYIGTGNPVGNAPCEQASRLLSKNLIYLCRKKAMTAKEFSEALNVPMVFIEEELQIQCHGTNGEYGTIRKLKDGKYIANIPVVDIEEFDEMNKVYENHLDEILALVKAGIDKHATRILEFPFLNEQNDISFVLWPMIPSVLYRIMLAVSRSITKKYFSNITPAVRPYTQTAIVAHECAALGYGNDGISAKNILNYKLVQFTNLYGNLIDAHFRCGHDIANDETLQMTIRAIGGLNGDSLSESDKEVVAKAIECGYLRKNGNTIEPKMLVLDINDDPKFHALAGSIVEGLQPCVDKIAEELGPKVKKNLPEHLIEDYPYYIDITTASRFAGSFINRCVEVGILCKPEKRLGAEGMTLWVTK